MTTPVHLHVVTPVTRWHLLGRVADSLRTLGGFDVRWHVVGSAGGGFGGRERTEALRRIPADDPGWVLFLDDDTTVHPDLGDVLAHALRLHPTADAVVWGQAFPDGRLRLRANADAGTGGIDTGSFAVRASVVAGVTWGDEYTADAAFWRAVRGRVGAGEVVTVDVVTVDAVGSVYNALR